MHIDRLRPLASVLALGVLAAACNSSGDNGKSDSGTSGTGGAVNSGGSGGTGAGPGSGGRGATGGTSGLGGTTTATGGAVGTAGANGGGGASAATIPGAGCTPPTAYANLFINLLGQTKAASDAKLAAAWSQLFNPSGANTIFFNGPGANESYVEDIADNDVRTEGMSYGMMIAVQLNHQPEFDRLWTFVKNHMAQTNGQIAWHVSTSGSVLATGGAPDGDEYFATALIFASKRWGTRPARTTTPPRRRRCWT